MTGRRNADGPFDPYVRDPAVNQGPRGTAPFIANLFTLASRTAESEAYQRLHTGTAGFGKSKIQIQGSEIFKHPDTGMLLPTGANGVVTFLDGEVLADRATVINAQREYCKSLFSQLFVSDEVLQHCTSREFLEDCDANVAAVGRMAGLPADLVGACCRPSVLFYMPESSELFARGVAKAAFMLQNHPHMRGIAVTGGKAHTHGKEPRSGRSALEEAVA